jgi:5-methyltetrahydropteroyltriglutamate--homocysteine methyltransferase
MAPPCPARCALQPLFSGGNGGTNNVETASSQTFVTAATPGILSTTLLRDPAHPKYASDSEYVYAIAREMKKEYELIVSRGHALQLDAPDLALEHQIMYLDRPLNEFLERVDLQIDEFNLAIADIPSEKL